MILIFIADLFPECFPFPSQTRGSEGITVLVTLSDTTVRLLPNHMAYDGGLRLLHHAGSFQFKIAHLLKTHDMTLYASRLSHH